MGYPGNNSDRSFEIARIENAMMLVAQHIARHVSQTGNSPFTVIFERLERERAKLGSQNATIDRAASYLNHSAIRESQSALTSKVAPEP